MTQLPNSLDEITTGYSVFEKDQVLTASQLNSIASYFEDQSRLTRTQLLGVGLVCGLNISAQGRQVTVSKGMGVTTDGDLLFYGSNMVFEKFKVYNDFYKDKRLIASFELASAKDKRAFPLSQFSERTNQNVANMVALLYMERFINDPDECAGTDCNNAGQTMTNNLKVLLVNRDYIGQLKPNIQTPHRAYEAMDEIVADRPLINSSVITHAQLVSTYRSACNSIHAKLAAQLPKIFPSCSSFIASVFTTDPSASWLTILNNWNTYYANNEIGIQYYYDFLRDLTETYNEFHELLFDENTWCSPDVAAFPRYIILGTVGRDPETDNDRTGLYPSRLVSHTLEQRQHAVFLISKLNTQLITFEVPALTKRIGLNVSVNLLENIRPAEMIIPSNLWRITGNTAIRITPGKSEEYCLEERAIPYYYKIDASHPIYENWNYDLHKKKKGACNYSYNAVNYGAQGASAAPFTSQIGKFDFFRIEGFMGQNIVDVHRFLENEISTNNLPINLRSVMLGEDKTKIVIKPPIYFGHLQQLHNMIRQDVVTQLDEVKQFSGGLKTKVNSSLDLLDPVDKGTFTEVAQSRDAELSSSIDMACAKLKGSYQDYTAQNTETDSWKNHVSAAMEQSGKFKGQLTIATKTEFNTPFDTLISNRHIDLLDRLDDLIKIDIEKKQDKLLFNNYIANHPGLEHSAGVMRGGTFVLVYDEGSTVIADFMLPYQETDAEKNDLLEPGISIKPFRPGYIIGQGLNLNIPIDRNIRGKIDDFKVTDLDGILNVKADGIRSQLDGAWNTKFNDQQKDYFTTIKESFTTVSGALIKRATGDTLTATNGLSFQDPALEKVVKEVTSQREVLASYKSKADQATDDTEKKRYSDMAGMIEEDLSGSINEATQYVADSGIDITVGTDGFNAMMEINNGLGAISSNTLLSKTTETLSKLAGSTRKASFNLMIGSMIKRS